MTEQASRNGESAVRHDPHRSRTHRRRRSQEARAGAGRPYAFSARDLARTGFHACLLFAHYLVGIGTQGSALVYHLVLTGLREFGRLPGPVDYLLLDAAPPGTGMDPTHHKQIGIDGAGTDPHRGAELFAQCYQEIRDLVHKHVQGIMQPDPEWPLKKHPRETLNFWVFGGAGGTSGGGWHPIIGLLHDVAQSWRIEEPRVRAVALGAEMPLRDHSRQVSREQCAMVRDTAANNLLRAGGDMLRAGRLHEPRPDGTSLSLAAGMRIWTIAVADQSNGQAQFSTADALTQELATADFVRIFTRAGVYLDERICDQNRLGAHQRGEY